MSASRLHTMAWRNVWRNRRRTLLTLVMFAFGALLAVVFTGMGDDSYSKMIELAARLGGGHVTYQHPGYNETPSLKKTVTDTGSLAEEALGDDRVARVVTRISGATMLATAGKSYGAGFLAIDPERESVETLALMDSLVEGEMFESADDKGIILGATLAENLGVELGKKVVYTMTDKHGEIVSGLARVRGIVRTGAPTADGTLCLLPIDTIRKSLGYEADEATLVAVFIDDQRRAAAVAKTLRQRAPQGVDVLTWQQVQPELAGFISTDRNSSIVFEVIVMVLIGAGIFNALFVSVMERLREFGIMMAVGFSPALLFGLVMWESLWLALVGLVAAAIVSAGPYYYFNTVGIDLSEMIGEGVEVSGVAMDPVIYVDIYPENLLIIASIMLVATLLAGVYPAWKAGRVVPVETIRLV